MATELRPVPSEANYDAALEEVERLWGAESGTPEGDRLDVLATLIEVYEANRVLSGLKDRMMTPEVAAEAKRTYAEETNRLNRERRSNGNAWQAELVKVEKDIYGIIEAIKAGMFHESMKGELAALENRKAELAALLVDAPEDKPDLLPTASTIYAKKVAKLTQALNRPAERQEAARPCGC